MTNVERQKSLDKKKYYASQIYNKDLSGNMIYCSKCEYTNCLHNCRATQKERETQCLCARAYNRMIRVK